MSDTPDEKNTPSAESPTSVGTLNEKLEAGTVAPSPPNIENVVTRDGIRVHPQPTTDPLDPLNWSFVQKHSVLAIVMLK
jgi:hypothetical protein